ncbi:hypothetical protein IC582_006241 [Cucumis melo]|uniref:Pre-mRNA-splicing factor cwc-21-like n=1 Tax=Cucumis melo TaxID=3656 RepID=A0A1S4DVI6_CUCME|nr:pre-mRNA-splicing factor cwc-21-like [Cucumis melo]XP_016899996.1 pre-mRNA-splicing factor cwc-21-like [Cucumis melo]XP_016899997.1 pre-mRNA-splicing factor cwc-21-like [Cucumis melo]
MNNRIGLQTARGSGTNGYIQTNKFFVRSNAESTRGFEDQATACLLKKPNKDILEHDRKRQIELKLFILEDELSDQGFTEKEIFGKLREARENLEAASSAILLADKRLSDTHIHQIAARKEKQTKTFRAALGLGSLLDDGELC